jgi:hypothetical protein
VRVTAVGESFLKDEYTEFAVKSADIEVIAHRAIFGIYGFSWKLLSPFLVLYDMNFTANSAGTRRFTWVLDGSFPITSSVFAGDA